MVYLHNAQDTLDWDRKNNLRIWDLADGEVVEAFDGQFIPQVPFWSPVGDEIGFVIHETRFGGRINLLDLNGGALRPIGDPGVRYESVFAWVPDGRLLLVKPGLTYPGPVSPPLELIRIDTGERIPLPFIGQLSHPSLRPLQ